MKNGGVFVSIALLVTITLVMGVILLTVDGCAERNCNRCLDSGVKTECRNLMAVVMNF